MTLKIGQPLRFVCENLILILVYFLEQLLDKKVGNIVGKLDEIYSFSSMNYEVKFQYFMLCLQFGISVELLPLVEKMLSEQGRMKFVRPLYRALAKWDRDLAMSIFKKYKLSYHAIAAKMIEIDLK
jgi:leukotriene-A4 hydrolase